MCSVSICRDNIVGDDVAVVVERGHSGRSDTSVGVDAEFEARVVRGSYKEHTRVDLLQMATNR